MRPCARCGGARKTRYATDFTDLCDRCALTDMVLDVNYRLLKGRLRGETSAPVLDPELAVEAILADMEAGKSFCEAVVNHVRDLQYDSVLARAQRLLLPV